MKLDGNFKFLYLSGSCCIMLDTDKRNKKNILMLVNNKPGISALDKGTFLNAVGSVNNCNKGAI